MVLAGESGHKCWLSFDTHSISVLEGKDFLTLLIKEEGRLL